MVLFSVISEATSLTITLKWMTLIETRLPRYYKSPDALIPTLVCGPRTTDTRYGIMDAFHLHCPDLIGVLVLRARFLPRLPGNLIESHSALNGRHSA